jgi:hypothetical protein
MIRNVLWISSRPQNAGAQKPKPLLGDGQRTAMWQQAVMRGCVCPMTDIGFGFLQYVVSSHTMPETLR